MKKLSFLIPLLICQTSFGQIDIQKVDTSNYYEYYANSGYDTLRTNWLTPNEVVPVIIEEMKLSGHAWLSDHTLFKLDYGQYFVLAAYSRKSNFGFLYIEGHASLPKKEHRNELTQKNKNNWGAEYVVCEETASGKANFIPIMKLPSNIFVLNENCYWYQATGNPEFDKSLFTKEFAIKILRQDIKRYLNSFKKK